MFAERVSFDSMVGRLLSHEGDWARDGVSRGVPVVSSHWCVPGNDVHAAHEVCLSLYRHC